MLRKAILGALLALGLVMSFLALGASSGTSTGRNYFWTRCGFVTSGTFDPVVYPGSTTTPHFHDFFGSLNINPDSTPGQLQAGGTGSTSCDISTDTASYWAPTLLLGPGERQAYHGSGGPCFTDAAGLTACHYTQAQPYYERGSSGLPPRSSLTNIPFGMEAVGGNSMATGVQSQSIVSWSCTGSSPKETHPYDCSRYIDLGAGADGIVVNLRMPDCWSGQNPSDRTSFTYSSGEQCPSGFPRLIPSVDVHFHTGIVTPCPGKSCPAGNTMTPDFGFELANGTMMPWYQAHADFMNGWQYGDQGTGDHLGGLDDIVRDCLILAQPCPGHVSTPGNMPT